MKNCELICDSPASDWKAIIAPVLIIAGTEDVISSVAAAETVKGTPLDFSHAQAESSKPPTHPALTSSAEL